MAKSHFYYDNYKAKKAYNDAVTLDQEDPTPHINLGMCYLLKDCDINAAKKAFEKGITIAAKKQTSVPWAHVSLSIIYWRCKNNEADQNLANKFAEQEKLHYEHAKRDFEYAIGLNGTDFWSYCGLGWCLAQENNYEKAIQYTSEALRIKDDFIQARYNLACQKAKLYKFSESMEDLWHLLDPIKPILKILEIERDSELEDIACNAEFQQFFKVLGLEYKYKNRKVL